MKRNLQTYGKISIEKARRAQRLLAEMVIEHDDFKNPPDIIGGVDVSYLGNRAVGVAVLLDFRTLELVEYATAVVDVKFPYVPTLLAFREFFPMAKAILSLKRNADIYMIDAQGRLHPYGLGAACHIGVVLDIPTIGVAKRLLCGTIGARSDDVAPVVLDDKIIGAAVWTGRSKKPIFVSVGHKVSLNTAIRLVKQTTRKGRKLPEPIRLAHSIATRYRSRIR
ncbi:MAG: endonuclease V [Candidatus Baldrarchaeia archaeon]